MRAPYVNPEGFHFTAYRSGLFSELGKVLGMQDIEVGYPRFDDDYVIKGNSEHRVRRFFDNERIRDLIEQQPRIHLQVRSDEGWFGARFPEGVDELYFRRRGVLKDLGQLESLFELFAESLHQLCHDGQAYEDDVDLHIERLRGPAGQIQGKHLLWDGDRPRRDAAAALGRLQDPKALGALASVLGSEDSALRAHVIDALASIAHRDAIRPLIMLLGDTSRAYATPIQDRVAAVLRTLGEGELVDAVLDALGGDVSRIREAVGAYRGQVIEAFVVALDGPTGTAAAGSLQELHAVEALPEMRKSLRRIGTMSRTGRAIQAAIRGLEARAVLPRPAEGREVGADTLPRVADDSGPERP